jgi:hypothetical protein
LFTLKDKKEIVSLNPKSAQFSLFVLDIKGSDISLMGTSASARMYLLIFHIDPITIELVVPEQAALIVCLVIALTVGAVTPVGTSVALRGWWNRRFAVGVTSATSCKFMVGVLEMGFAALWAYWSPLGAVFIRVAPLPALPAKWGSY